MRNLVNNVKNKTATAADSLLLVDSLCRDKEECLEAVVISQSCINSGEPSLSLSRQAKIVLLILYQWIHLQRSQETLCNARLIGHNQL